MKDQTQSEGGWPRWEAADVRVSPPEKPYPFWFLLYRWLHWFLQFVSSQVTLACLVFGQGISHCEHNRNQCTVIIDVILWCCKQNSFLCCPLLFAWSTSKPRSFWIIVIYRSSANMSVCKDNIIPLPSFLQLVLLRKMMDKEENKTTGFLAF